MTGLQAARNRDGINVHNIRPLQPWGLSWPGVIIRLYTSKVHVDAVVLSKNIPHAKRCPEYSDPGHPPGFEESGEV